MIIVTNNFCELINMNRIIYFRNMPLFGKSQKNPVEVVKQLKDAVVALEKGDKKLEKVCVDYTFILFFEFIQF